jgi:hypothetical protein
MPIVHDVVAVVTPLVVAVITYYASDWLLAYRHWADRLPADIKRGVVLAVSAIITLMASRLAVALPTDLVAWTPDTIDAVVSAAIAMAMKAGNTAKAAKDGDSPAAAPETVS